jgi:hypothetical protein
MLMIEPTTAERNIIEALGEGPLTVEQLAIKAGYELSGHFRKTVASLRKRGILGNNRPGYYVMPEYRWVLQVLEP